MDPYPYGRPREDIGVRPDVRKDWAQWDAEHEGQGLRTSAQEVSKALAAAGLSKYEKGKLTAVGQGQFYREERKGGTAGFKVEKDSQGRIWVKHRSEGAGARYGFVNRDAAPDRPYGRMTEKEHLRDYKATLDKAGFATTHTPARDYGPDYLEVHAKLK
jgi:hypothetical protein